MGPAVRRWSRVMGASSTSSCTQSDLCCARSGLGSRWDVDRHRVPREHMKRRDERGKVVPSTRTAPRRDGSRSRESQERRRIRAIDHPSDRTANPTSLMILRVREVQISGLHCQSNDPCENYIYIHTGVLPVGLWLFVPPQPCHWSSKRVIAILRKQDVIGA